MPLNLRVINSVDPWLWSLNTSYVVLNHLVSMQKTHTHMHGCTHTHTHTHTHMHTYHTHTHTHTYIHTVTHMCTHIHTYIHTYMHTHTQHIHTYTHCLYCINSLLQIVALEKNATADSVTKEKKKEKVSTHMYLQPGYNWNNTKWWKTNRSIIIQKQNNIIYTTWLHTYAHTYSYNASLQQLPQDTGCKDISDTDCCIKLGKAVKLSALKPDL